MHVHIPFDLPPQHYNNRRGRRAQAAIHRKSVTLARRARYRALHRKTVQFLTGQFSPHQTFARAQTTLKILEGVTKALRT